MAQRGRIFRKGSSWFLMYRTPIVEGGKRRMKQVVKKLAPCSDQYRSESSVRPLAEEILGPINAGTIRPESTQTVKQFLEHYLAVCDTRLRPSTCQGYRDMFRLVEPHLGDIVLRNFHTPEADKLMKAATSDKQRAHTTHRNLKSFLSGAFKYAKRTGVVSENPVRDAEIPRGKAKGERAAYTLDEISEMLEVLPEPSRTVVFTAALTGLRVSELKGLRWEDFDGDSLLIQRSVWSGKVADTKTLASKAFIPIVPQLQEVLTAHKRRDTSTGYVFQGGTGKPLRVENLLRRQMRKPMAKAGIDWRGWHPFRYGVGTTLKELGVDIKLVQQILRHSDQRLTMDFYIKPTLDQTRKAMTKLERALGKSLARKKA
ncbi:MAG TPA: tyrosine-type recombinase/integrase [Candidatus Baltobacteraceae bacterium]|jgi:integrase|nr:tyrosine-type recombinase/integrase [Candidatus Baltobacteraceae bacterium]